MSIPRPRQNVAYTFSRCLFSTVDGQFVTNPTIAAGDFVLYQDNVLVGNLTNLPTVAPAGSTLVQFSLTASEMNASRIDIIGQDQAGNEWGDIHEEIHTLSAAQEAADAAIIADVVLRRLASNVEASSFGDALISADSLLGLVLRASHSDTTTHAGKWTVFKSDGITELDQIDITTGTADDITAIGS